MLSVPVEGGGVHTPRSLFKICTSQEEDLHFAGEVIACVVPSLFCFFTLAVRNVSKEVDCKRVPP